ncbi:Protein of unknown function [Cotesia congregata]|uniref:Uncharacterized protein n=1 Tax=Cotesia congregata TaxID=51543 RepID=A0A8J2MI19_COTCN|nr:Protein of unknown function [Cotesia congregata]
MTKARLPNSGLSIGCRSTALARLPSLGPGSRKKLYTTGPVLAQDWVAKTRSNYTGPRLDHYSTDKSWLISLESRPTQYLSNKSWFASVEPRPSHY